MSNLLFKRGTSIAYCSTLHEALAWCAEQADAPLAPADWELLAEVFALEERGKEPALYGVSEKSPISVVEKSLYRLRPDGRLVCSPQSQTHHPHGSVVVGSLDTRIHTPEPGRIAIYHPSVAMKVTISIVRPDTARMHPME